MDVININSVMIKLNDKWVDLCGKYLPVTHSDNSIWRSSRDISSEDQEQGWKIHVSATILNANEILKRVAPYLQESGVLFKAPVSLSELQKLNCGLYYGFSQVGKFITVYPRNDEESLTIAERLHDITCEFNSPAVPYDLPFQEKTCVYYRYGSFSSLEIVQPDGKRIPAVHGPDGNLVPDLREPGAAAPKWLKNPFLGVSKGHEASNNARVSPLSTEIRAYEALSQRGKGGVYRAIDLSVSPARPCILKEGRLYGETDWDGRNGYWRVQHELDVLTQLRRSGIEVPIVYTSFKVESNFYIAIESIEGQSLQSIINKKISVRDTLNYGVQIAGILDKIHSAGWVWRDCKPMNLIVNDEGIIRPIDFEGACLIEQPDNMPWGTPGYTAPEMSHTSVVQSRIYEDLYALGATLHHLFTRQIPTTANLQPIGKLRRNVPASVRQIIAGLLNHDPHARPNARTVLKILESSLTKDFSNKSESPTNDILATAF